MGGRFDELSPEAQEIVRGKISKLSPEAQSIVNGKLGISAPSEMPGGKPSFLDSIAKSSSMASKFYTPALSVGGAIGAGALATAPSTALGPFAPLGIAAAGAGGYAAGKGLARRIDEFLGIAKRPEGLKEGLGQTGGDLAEGVKQELTGGAVSGGIGLLRTAGKPALAQITQNAARRGVELSPADITGSKPLSQIESALAKNPFTSGTIQEFRNKQAAQMANATADTISVLGTNKSPTAVGQAIQEGIASKSGTRFVGSEKLYKRLDEIVPQDSIIPTTRLSEKAQELLLKESQISKGVQNTKVLSTLTDLTKYREQGLSWQGTKNLRQRLNELIGDQGRGLSGNTETGIYRQLKKALDSDIAEFSESSGGKVQKLYEISNTFYSKQKTLFQKNKDIQAITKRNPADVIDFILKPDHETEAQILEKAIPSKTWETVKDGTVNRLFETSARGDTPDQALIRNLRRFGEGTVEKIIGKEKLGKLKDFASIAQRVGMAEKMAGNPSGTAQNVLTGTAVGYIITHPIKGTVLAVTAPTLAKIYMSPFTRQAITEGFKTPVAAKQAADIAARLTTIVRSRDK